MSFALNDNSQLLNPTGKMTELSAIFEVNSSIGTWLDLLGHFDQKGCD